MEGGWIRKEKRTVWSHWSMVMNVGHQDCGWLLI
jgi:hypothetical protein